MPAGLLSRLAGGGGWLKGNGEIEAFFEDVDAVRWAELNRSAGRKDKASLGYRFASSVPVPRAVIQLW